MSESQSVKPYENNSYLFLTPIDNKWKEIETKNQYPTPQGNLPMIKFLKQNKQSSLVSSYDNVCNMCKTGEK